MKGKSHPEFLFLLLTIFSSRRAWLTKVSGLLLGLSVRQSPGAGLKTSSAEGGKSQPSTNFNQVITKALNGQPWQPSDAIHLDVPQLAENGAIVPLTIESRLPDTRRLLIFAERNPGPLLAEFHFEPGANPWASLRVKLNETGPLLAVAESAGEYYGREMPVKVMLGGCG
jgi:sulfur-oxidizing protein SoxY